ncbi:hypothetical protein HanRHA438_Chr02g0085801 [Helianthus annuus]|nr:hypothetical protein HanRHA438_Chr02g0085801 [Helianthus annuus]
MELNIYGLNSAIVLGISACIGVYNLNGFSDVIGLNIWLYVYLYINQLYS